MKQRTKWFVGLATAAVLALSAGVFAACTDPDDKDPDEGGNETVAVEGISFAEDEITLEVGQSVQLEVIFTPENATNKNVIWSVDFDDTVTVDENGLVTAKEDAAGKACTVTATAEEGDGLYEAYCSVTVIAARGEAITKTSEVGDGTNTLTIYEYGGVELTGKAAAGATALDIEPYSGTYQIVDNAPVFSGQVTAMGFNFPILVGATFQDQNLQLRLYLNNGTADFELGTYEFTKEEAARLVGSTHVEGGIDTTVAYVQATIAGSNAADSVALWSDGKAVFTVGQFVLLRDDLEEGRGGEHHRIRARFGHGRHQGAGSPWRRARVDRHPRDAFRRCLYGRRQFRDGYEERHHRNRFLYLGGRSFARDGFLQHGKRGGKLHLRV